MSPERGIDSQRFELCSVETYKTNPIAYCMCICQFSRLQYTKLTKDVCCYYETVERRDQLQTMCLLLFAA